MRSTWTDLYHLVAADWLTPLDSFPLIKSISVHGLPFFLSKCLLSRASETSLPELNVRAFRFRSRADVP